MNGNGGVRCPRQATPPVLDRFFHGVMAFGAAYRPQNDHLPLSRLIESHVSVDVHELVRRGLITQPRPPSNLNARQAKRTDQEPQRPTRGIPIFDPATQEIYAGDPRRVASIAPFARLHLRRMRGPGPATTPGFDP
jgi:hypothetical protein